jgi:hypothetical protein
MLGIDDQEIEARMADDFDQLGAVNLQERPDQSFAFPKQLFQTGCSHDDLLSGRVAEWVLAAGRPAW